MSEEKNYVLSSIWELIFRTIPTVMLKKRDWFYCYLVNKEWYNLARRFLKPNTQDLFWACKEGKPFSVKFLLQQPHIQVGLSNCEWCLIVAAQNGHGDIVKILLDDGRIDPACCHNLPIKKAVQFQHEKIVKMLLELPIVVQTLSPGTLAKFLSVYNVM